MKTKQAKEDLDKGTDEEIIEPKTRARKKASDINEEDKNKTSQDDPKTSKDPPKKTVKPKVVIKKRPLGIRKTKTLRNKKNPVAKKNVLRQTVTRARKAAIKTESNCQDKEAVPLIPASEIKKEPLDDPAPNSRSSSPKTQTKKARLSSDMVMMKSVLGDSTSTLVLGPRLSPYSMRSERSNSPSLFEGKNLRSGKPRKVKNNFLNEIVIKEQKKRRRLLSESKSAETPESAEDCKKLKRGRSCSREGSEISKCSDITESDISLTEGLSDTVGSKELNKKFDKSKTDLDIYIENNVQISTIGKVPSLSVDSKLAETKLDTEPDPLTSDKKKKKMSLIRKTSLDSDNNNGNRLKLDSLQTQEIEEKLLLKTENDTLFEERSSILNCMSKTFNSKEVSKNIRRARRGRKKEVADRAKPNPLTIKNGISSSTITNDSVEDKQESIDTLTKEINDLIYNLDQNIDQEMNNDASENTEQAQPKTFPKLYGQSKPLCDNNSIIAPDTPIKEKDTISSITNETTPSKNDDSENIRLHYEEDSVEKSTENREITYKHTTVASIDKLMDRLKVFEEFDKRRQRQESESKSSDMNSVMVTSEVVLVNKSGADIKPLKDLQAARSPEKIIEKENVLSCFENNAAISIVKRDQVRKSIDIDLPNSVTLIKRNSFSARKESTSSNHSKESDAISIFEKSLGKDVTLTEIRKSVDKSTPPTQIDLHQFTNPQQPETQSPAVTTMVLNSSQISITPRIIDKQNISGNEIQITKRKSLESISRKSSESGAESEEKMATLEKIRSPPHQLRSPAISITPTPVAVKSPEAAVPMETEAQAPPLDNIKTVPEEITLTSEVSQMESRCINEPTSNVVATMVVEPILIDPPTLKSTEAPTLEKALVENEEVKISIPEALESVSEIKETAVEAKETKEIEKDLVVPEIPKEEEKKEIVEEVVEKPVVDLKSAAEGMPVDVKPAVVEEPVAEVKPKSPKTKSARNSTEIQPGPSTVLHETPESQKRKENVLRTLGLLTHKAANEAKIEKMKQKERIYGQNYCGMVSTSKGKVKSDYTGTLKTVIKLNRGAGEREKKKYRSSLKMTFQKSKNRSGKPPPEVGETGSEDDAYYTIEKREGGAGATSDGGHRKSHNSSRLNNHDGEAPPEPEPKETLNLVIPEKASSFSIHPGRLCMDQCFYCGGKFGLYDTPCHIAQMKSTERQKKVLNNEEKLTIDSCLCDACYRHVDRRANCPSYRKRPAGKQPSPPLPATEQPDAQAPLAQTTADPSTQTPAPETVPPTSPSQAESEEEPPAGPRLATCHTEGCSAPADHSIRRKWLIKMRSSVNKLLKLECDYPGLHTIPLCAAHHRALAPLMACALCRRRLTKHHNLCFIHHGYTDLNPLLTAAGIPVQFTERPVLCKVCRYYCTLLQRPGHNDKHAHAYRRRLLQIYNIEIPPELEQEAGDSALLEDCTNSANKQKKKARTKSKQRKSSDPEKPDSESSERTTESSPEKEKVKEDEPLNEAPPANLQPLEEDIESLISSNKIPVPGAKPTDTSMETIQQQHFTDAEMTDADAPLIPVDKQTELQYLLQKQNNPAQFLPKPPNMTQKHKNILKIHNVGITKLAQQQKVTEKNAKRIQKLGQIVTHKDKPGKKESEMEIFDPDKAPKELSILKNISLNDECTIESIPNKKPADINTLKNKWQMSDSFTQVKRNLSELSKKLPAEKEPKKLPETKYSNPVKRLETNPSISVRELFPGEEEMNLQCNIEFNNVKGVTPEGWEKCNTMIQYDAETKRLWTELQRPYGNQSSFLRHLILLEKYFRSGDLILSHNASPHAANYSTSVQSRLRAYDSVAPETKRNEPSVSLIEFRKKPSMNSKSLLKSNLNADEKNSSDPKKFMPPPGAPPKKPKADRAKSKALPPELIAITPYVQGRKAIQNVLQNIQQLVTGVTASDSTEVAASPVPKTKPDTPKEKKEMPGLKPEPPKDKKDVLPPKYEATKDKKESTKSDTPKKQKSASKAWRPTLMPITQENLAKIAREPLRLAVDGHNLPSLVQVLSAGNRYHITFEDYNKMCLIRRERQQRLQDREAKNKRRTSEETSVVTEIQSKVLGNGGTIVQNIPTEKEPSELQLGANAATILKNVGLKNITIAPIPPKTSTVTSLTAVSTPAMASIVTTPMKIPVLSMSEAAQAALMPKIPKSLTVIPQTAPDSRP